MKKIESQGRSECTHLQSAVLSVNVKDKIFPELWCHCIYLPVLKCNCLVLETRNLSKDAFELLKIDKEIFHQYLASYPYGRTGTYCPFCLQVQLITPESFLVNLSSSSDHTDTLTLRGF